MKIILYTYGLTRPESLAVITKDKAEVRFNITEGTEPSIDPQTEEPVTLPIFTCEKAIVDYPLDYAQIVDAMIRTRYTQGDVEAILRHKINGDEGAEEAYNTFNAFAESCKQQAQEILNDTL